MNQVRRMWSSLAGEGATTALDVDPRLAMEHRVVGRLLHRVRLGNGCKAALLRIWAGGHDWYRSVRQGALEAVSGLDVMLLKGPTASLVTDRPELMRRSGDLDLLVRGATSLAVMRSLAQHGVVRLTDKVHEFAALRTARGERVDVHRYLLGFRQDTEHGLRYERVSFGRVEQWMTELPEIGCLIAGPALAANILAQQIHFDAATAYFPKKYSVRIGDILDLIDLSGVADRDEPAALAACADAMNNMSAWRFIVRILADAGHGVPWIEELVDDAAPGGVFAPVPGVGIPDNRTFSELTEMEAAVPMEHLRLAEGSLDTPAVKATGYVGRLDRTWRARMSPYGEIQLRVLAGRSVMTVECRAECAGSEDSVLRIWIASGHARRYVALAERHAGVLHVYSGECEGSVRVEERSIILRLNVRQAVCDCIVWAESKQPGSANVEPAAWDCTPAVAVWGTVGIG